MLVTRFVRRLRPAALLLLSASLSVLSACGGGGGSGNGGGGGGSGGGSCGESARKAWVLDVARDWYLFPETLPASVDLAAYATAEDLLDALTATARDQGKDRYFSYLTTKAEENSLFAEGEFVGFGFRNRTDDGNRPFIVDVFAASPASEAGLRRGDEIIAVNSGSGFVPVSQSLVDGTTISDLLGPANVGVARGLRLLRDGATVEVSMSKRVVTLDPVPDGFGTAVLPLAGTTGVGYVHLRSYISTADPQLRAAFADFRARNLQYYIVDVRYNGGGLVSTSELLNDLLGGARSTNDVQYRVLHNPARSNQNSTVRFQARAESVSPVRVAFLTTNATASASEINANSMKPWVETAIVGSDTLGKPVGQYAFDLQGCEDRLRLIAFKTVNSLGEGDYYSGLASSMQFACAGADALDTPLGSSNDSLVQEAMYWLSNGACRTTMSAGAADARLKPFGTRPATAPRRPHELWLPGLQ